MKNQISNCVKNFMGTLDFDGHFQGMRKPGNFIVYPLTSGTTVSIQSDNRFGKIDLATGAGVLSASKRDANSPWLMVCMIRKTTLNIQLSPEDLTLLRGAIKSTGGALVGELVKSDNSGASSL